MLRRRLMSGEYELILSSYHETVGPSSDSIYIYASLKGKSNIDKSKISVTYNGNVYSVSIGTNGRLTISYYSNSSEDDYQYGEVVVYYGKQSKIFTLEQTEDYIEETETGQWLKEKIKENRVDESIDSNSVVSYYSGRFPDHWLVTYASANEDVYDTIVYYTKRYKYASGSWLYDEDSTYEEDEFIKTRTVDVTHGQGVGYHPELPLGGTISWTRSGYSMTIERISDSELHWECSTTGESGYCDYLSNG